MTKKHDDTDIPLERPWAFGSPEWHAHGRDGEDQGDITDDELRAIQNQVDAEIEQHSLPTDEQLRQKVERVNVSTPRGRNGRKSRR